MLLTGTSSYHQPTGNQSEKISLRSSKEDIENSSFRPQFGGLERRDSKTGDCTDTHAHHTRLGGVTSTSEPESVEEPATSNDLPDLPATIPASSPSFLWGTRPGVDVKRVLDAIYSQVVVGTFSPYRLVQRGRSLLWRRRDWPLHFQKAALWKRWHFWP